MIKQSNFLYCFFIIAIILPRISYAKITATASINSITVEEIISQVDSDTLVLVNINNTILTPRSKMFRYNNNPYISFMDNMASLSTGSELIAQLILQRKMMLVEANWPEFINKLKSKGAYIFGFVKTDPPYKKIKDFEEWQYNQLSEFGINFTPQINNKNSFRFDDKNENRGIFYNGIIFTGFLSKTQSLVKFLSLTNLKPLKIIIFENRKIDLERINVYLRTIDLEYYGIEYMAAKEIKGSPDLKTAEFQQKTFLDTGKWLEDEEATRLMNTNQVQE